MKLGFVRPAYLKLSELFGESLHLQVQGGFFLAVGPFTL